MISISNAPYLNKIDKCMARLNRLGENNLFVSQFRENDKDEATIIVRCVKHPDDEAVNEVTEIRRLLTALKYRIAENGLQLNFTLTKKRGK